MLQLLIGSMEHEQFYKYLQDVDLLNDETVEDMKKLTEDFPWFQAGWMLYLKNLKNINSSDYDTVLKKVAVIVPERKNLFKFLNAELLEKELSIEKLKLASTVYQLEGGAESVENNSLIDKFLNSDTGIIRKNKVVLGAPINVENKEFVHKSVAENDELITETLAVIYFQQKNYEKAQIAYQKLSLKYPEKSVYFAARIKEIEVLKNNN